MSLNEISIKYKMDKNIASGCHNYIPGYTELFEKKRNNVKKMLEIGIGSVENGQMSGVINYGYKTGNSLKCWNEYFPNATIYGVDIYEHNELNTENIIIFKADQSNETDLTNIIKTINDSLDIIIDDGSHLGEHQIFSFLFLNKWLSKGGIYVIEDIQPNNIDKFLDLSIFPKDSINYIKDNFIIQYFDTRKDFGRADDFMMAFIKK
jgi:8-demethyl-8-alpha-L-rhamnosyltetracenomycin-C 2'-O-methyltransferase